MMMMTSMLRLYCLQSLAIASSTIATSSSDSSSSSNVIVDNVSDDEHPNIIQRPVIKTAGGIELTDSTTHTSSTSSSRKIKDITINNKQKLDNDNEKGIINSSSRNLNNNDVTTNLWTMNDPTIDYSENEFDGTNRLRLGYTTSDMIDETMFTSTWWTTDCKAGGKKIETTGVGYRFIYTSSTDQLGTYIRTVCNKRLFIPFAFACRTSTQSLSYSLFSHFPHLSLPFLSCVFLKFIFSKSTFLLLNR